MLTFMIPECMVLSSIVSVVMWPVVVIVVLVTLVAPLIISQKSTSKNQIENVFY